MLRAPEWLVDGRRRGRRAKTGKRANGPLETEARALGSLEEREGLLEGRKGKQGQHFRGQRSGGLVI